MLYMYMCVVDVRVLKMREWGESGERHGEERQKSYMCIHVHVYTCMKNEYCMYIHIERGDRGRVDDE